ncbi:MAG: hypothetical protein VXZ39_13245, partial [Planctomycetota bacterium]|nr:hypothetical protein [Planctomycetota bacterium]
MNHSIRHQQSTLQSVLSSVSLRAAGLVAAATAGFASDVPQADQLPLGFTEAFALAEDRGAVLDQLVAGTDEHDFYTSLWLQGEGRLGEVPAVLNRWKVRSGETAAWRRIEARQALLNASNDPAATYRFLEEELGLEFDHRRRVQGEVPDRPTRLDQELIDTERLLGEVLQDRTGKRLRRVSDALLEQLVRRQLTDRQRVELLQRLPRADVPGMVQAVLADFDAFPKLSFGGRKIHGQLTLAQLEALRGARPQVLSNAAYVDAVMRRLVPGADASIDDPAEEQRYLERAWAFAATLPPAFNSLKAHLLYRWIERDLERGELDRARFVSYLRLPRNAPHVIVRREDRGSMANLREDFSGRTPFPPVGDDREVVEASLHLLLRDARGADAFFGVLEEAYVKRLFAEAKLLHGDPADAERYIEMLGGPAALEALRARVELDFARGCREFFGSDDEVSLEVDVKNVSDLIVKVFEIDPIAVFDRLGHLGVSGLDLDGLVPSSERTFTYEQNALTRHRETLEFPSLARPGTFVIELVGGGVSSRAVVRKGTLHLVGGLTEAGHVFRVLDENRAVVRDAILRFGGRDYLPEASGELFVPFSTRGGRRKALLRRGDLAVVTAFDHATEEYALDAAVFAPGEALVSGSDATFTVRPRLTVAGERASLELLQGASLVVTSTDFDGARSTKVLPLAAVDAGAILTADITVPERVKTFEVQLSARVRSVSLGEDVELTAPAASFPINRLQSMSTRMSLLTRRPQGYVLEVRGRTGEPLRDVEVTVELRHRWFVDAQRTRLKTDGQGRIDLGVLDQVCSVRLSEPSELVNDWELEVSDLHGMQEVLHGRTGGVLRIPYTGRFTAPDRRAFSLIEFRGGVPARDAFAAISVENRYVVLRGLAAGDYRLELKESGGSGSVRITDGVAVAGYDVGRHRALSASPKVPLQIVDVARADGGLAVQLAGAGAHTRLHVAATKFIDPFEAAGSLRLSRSETTRTSTVARPRSGYESGRVISDEYRYILDRRDQDIFPGNMLRRPGYLLNPWVVSRTEDRMADEGRAGELFAESGGASALLGAGRLFGGRAGAKRGVTSTHNRTMDFLVEPAVTLVNLVPDEEGRVLVPADALGPNHMLRLVATDDALTVAWDVTLPEQDLARRDLRLVEPLDAGSPMTQSRRIAFVPAGESIEIRDATSADAKTFDTIGDVFDLFRTIAGEGSELVKFEFLTRWPDLGADEKRALYSEFACHELGAFVKRRDRTFFDQVVAPYLANKGHRTFMDDWLLEADLIGYLEPWRFERLNVVERILLLQRTGGDDAQLARDLMALVPRSEFSLDATFGTVLAAGGLDREASLGIGGAVNQIRGRGSRRAEVDTRRVPAPEGPSSPGPTVAGRELKEVERSVRSLAELDGAEALFDEEADEASLGLEPIAGLSAADDERRQRARGFFFRDLDSTEEYAETHYWRVRLGDTTGDLVSVSPFWVDFAEAGGSFVSGQFPLATRSTTEMLLALAFLDLPFEAAEHEVIVDGRSVRMTAGSPLLLALEDIGEAAPAEGSPEVLVGQDFFVPEQRTVVVDGVERERYVTGEFLTGRPYGCRVVITNPSSAAIDLQVLLQVPEGAIPLAGTHYTKGVPVSVGPYGTRSIETFFYFPGEGTF